MEQFVQNIKDEIENDTYHLGLSSMSAAEIATILNSPIVIPTGETKVVDALVLKITNGIIGAPNFVTEQDVLTALA